MNQAKTCPFLKKKCIEHECMMFTHLVMNNPQTGMSTDQYGCSIAFWPVLQIEGSNQTRHVQAAVESMRNEVTARQDTFNQLAVEARESRKQLTDG
jgi:hypothetical protein